MENFLNDSKKTGIEDSFEIRVKKKKEPVIEQTTQPPTVSKDDKKKFKLDSDKIKNTSKGDLANELLKILNS